MLGTSSGTGATVLLVREAEDLVGAMAPGEREVPQSRVHRGRLLLRFEGSRSDESFDGGERVGRYGARRMVCHGRERQRRPMVTIASTIHATRDGRSRPTERTRRRATRAPTSAAGGRDARFLGESAPRGPAEDLRVAGDRNRPDASGREYGAIVPFADSGAHETPAERARYLCSAADGYRLTRRARGRSDRAKRSPGRPGPDDPDRGIAIVGADAYGPLLRRLSRANVVARSGRRAQPVTPPAVSELARVLDRNRQRRARSAMLLVRR